MQQQQPAAAEAASGANGMQQQQPAALDLKQELHALRAQLARLVQGNIACSPLVRSKALCSPLCSHTPCGLLLIQAAYQPAGSSAALLPDQVLPLDVQGLRAAVQAARGGALPANGTAAALQDLLTDLQALLAPQPANGAALPPANIGAAQPPQQQQQQMVVHVLAADARAIREAVERAAGPQARAIQRHLDDVVAAVKTGGYKVCLGSGALQKPC
jgi:hypothetical protein